MTLNLKKNNPIDVKFCGLTSVKDLNLAASLGARYAGFVFFEKSPRSLTFGKGRKLALEAPIGLAKVALVVDAQFSFLDELTRQVPIDMIQLHGSESPKIVHDIRERYGLPVMKAIGVSSKSDTDKVINSVELENKELFEIKSKVLSDKDNYDVKNINEVRDYKITPKVEALIPLPPKPKYSYLNKWLLRS